MTNSQQAHRSEPLARELGATSRHPDCTLDALTVQLEPLLKNPEARSRSGGAEVAALLRAYAEKEQSWQTYVHYRDDTYSRNLIWRCGDFELLLLCWNQGQESPIHDHAGQQCWMAVLEGELEEVHFEVAKGTQDKDGTPCVRPERGRAKGFPAGGVAFIDDEIALHLVRPKPGGRAVSLHLYSKPIDTCRVFCPDTGEPTSSTAAYHTVRGEPAEGMDPAAIRAAWNASGDCG